MLHEVLWWQLEFSYCVRTCLPRILSTSDFLKSTSIELNYSLLFLYELIVV